jgi:hypothetical protein
MTDFTNVGISEELKLQSTNIPTLSDLDIVKKIWWFEDGMWKPDGLNRGGAYEMFRAGSDEEPGVYVNLFEIISDTYGAPLLATDEGLVVQKDISAGGFVGSNQGELWLGSGRGDQLDVPKIVLIQSETSRVYGGGPLDIDPIPASATLPTKKNGKLVLLTVPYAGNPPGTIYRCFGDEPGGEWQPKGHYTEFPGNFDTLYITKFNGQDPAHLDVGNISIHGHLGVGDTVTTDLNPNPNLDLGNDNNPWANVVTSNLWIKSSHTKFGVTAGDQWNGVYYDAYLHPQNPAYGGLGLGTANYPFKWLDATSVFCDVLTKLTDENAIGIPVGIDVGYGVQGREVNAGKIIYQEWSDALDIVGAGTTSGNRKIKFWAEGGTVFAGDVTAHNVNPDTSNTYGCGGGDNYWAGVVTNMLYYKGVSMFGCAKELSDQIVDRKFANVEDAIALIKHETSKDWRHLKYGQKDGTVVCTCGKEVEWASGQPQVCPEHQTEWEDRYLLKTGDLIEASAKVIPHLLDRIEKLEKQIDGAA